MSDDLVKSLLGAVGVGGALLIWLLVRGKRNGAPRESTEAMAARNAAVERVTDKLEDARREILAEIVTTRHDLRGMETETLTRILNVLEEVKDAIRSLDRRRRP